MERRVARLLLLATSAAQIVSFVGRTRMDPRASRSRKRLRRDGAASYGAGQSAGQIK
jgi:hypothetical protein